MNIKPDERSCGWRPSMAAPKAFANRFRGPLVALRSFSRPPIPQSDARSAAVLVDELHAGCFQGQAYFGPGLVTAAQRTVLSLQALDSWDRNIGSSCQLLL
jgi:hypothetical protein